MWGISAQFIQLNNPYNNTTMVLSNPTCISSSTALLEQCQIIILIKVILISNLY